jgi:hypothetical protein
MSSEEKIIIAFVFKKIGAPKIDFTKLYLTLSMELNWFTPEEAKNFIDNAVKHNLAKKENGAIKPNFDIEKINIPVGFYPSKDLFKDIKIEKVEKKDVLNDMINKIVKELNNDEKTIVKKIRKIEKEKNLTSEVAALLVGKEYEINLEDFFNDIEKDLFN